MFIIIGLLLLPYYTEASTQWIKKKDVSLEIGKNNNILLKYKNKIFRYPNPKNKYIGIKKVIKADINGDGEKEYIIGAQLPDNPNDKYSYAFGCVLIFSHKKEGFYPDKVFFVGDWFEDVRFFDINKDGVLDLVVEGNSGAHWSELRIVSYQNRKYVTLWNTGSPSGAFFQVDKEGTAQVKIGIPLLGEKKGWCYADEPDWEIWEWDSKEEKFVYSQGKTRFSRVWQLQSKVIENIPAFSKMIEWGNHK